MVSHQLLLWVVKNFSLIYEKMKQEMLALCFLQSTNLNTSFSLLWLVLWGRQSWVENGQFLQRRRISLKISLRRSVQDLFFYCYYYLPSTINHLSKPLYTWSYQKWFLPVVCWFSGFPQVKSRFNPPRIWNLTFLLQFITFSIRCLFCWFCSFCQGFQFPF